MFELTLLKENLETCGFVHLSGFLDSEDIQKFEEAHNDLLEDAHCILQEASDSRLSLAEYYRQSKGSLIVVPERDIVGEICRFEYLFRCNRTIHSLILSKILPVIEALTGERYVLFKDKCNEKPSGGGAFKPHQDFAAYQPFKPRLFITAMVPLVDTNLQNGCLQFAVNYKQVAAENPDFVTEKNGSYPLFSYHVNGQNNGDILAEICENLKWKPVPTERGDVVIFDSYVPHHSEPNRSQSPRQTMFFTFNAMRDGNWYESYYQSKRAEYDNPSFHVSTPTEHALFKCVD